MFGIKFTHEIYLEVTKLILSSNLSLESVVDWSSIGGTVFYI